MALAAALRIRNRALLFGAAVLLLGSASSGRMLGQMYALTGNRAEAEDAVAEAFTRAWQRWARIRDYDNPETWVRQVASRIAISSWRKTMSRLHAHRREAVSIDLPGLSEDRVALVRALQQIPANQRRAVVLHHMADLSVAQIAEEMNAPAGTVKAYLARGRRALAAQLGDPSFEEAQQHG